MNLFLSKISALSAKTMLCVGLDTDLKKIPSFFAQTPQSLFAFNKAIIDATHDLVCCYKPQIAYYSAQGAEEQLQQTIQYIHTTYPEIPVILDSKRGDIGETAQMYALEAFERYEADAVTVNPYMGGDTLIPFLNYKDKGIIVLCKTSNPGSAEVQNLLINGDPLYQAIARKASQEWNGNKNILLVVGGTHYEELHQIRRCVGDDMVFLVPGVGAQGGNVREVIKKGGNLKGRGLIINSSRGIIYASTGKNFAEAARVEAQKIVSSLYLA